MTDQELSPQIQAIVAELFTRLGFEVSIQVDALESEQRKYWDIKVHTEADASELIGRHGSTLEGIASVIGLMLPKGSYGVLLDINGHREERSQDLQNVALQAAQQAIDGQHEIVMEPMKHWERRIVHSTLTGRTDVVTESFGQDPDRRVVIKPVTVY
jgi:predicted RNA-binding protein Jag